MKKIYLSGKMTGLTPRQIKRNFAKIEKGIAKHHPDAYIMNPAVTYNMKKYDAFSYEDWLHIDFAMIDACDIICLLPNWEDSMGAKKEIAYAYKHGKCVCFPVTISSFNFGWVRDDERAERIAIDLEKDEVYDALDDLLDSFAEAKARKALEEEIGQIRAN